MKKNHTLVIMKEDLSIVLTDDEAEAKRTSTTGTGNAIIRKLGLDRRLKQQLQNG